MKKELTYFGIDGCVGGNQEWFTNVVMYMGGCAAATACDSCIYYAKEYGMNGLYPYDIEHLNRADYVRFGQKMKPYIRPRVGGVRKLAWYVDGLARYIQDMEREHKKSYGIRMEEFSGDHSVGQAEEAVARKLTEGLPVPYLMLKHQDEERFKDFIWHWFLLIGCEGSGEKMTVTAATYGEAVKLPFYQLWDTGYAEKGGMILYSLR
nr:hypothetical protein [uncultured Merdimonas sp.]